MTKENVIPIGKIGHFLAPLPIVSHQNSRYFAASGAQDWAEQNEDIAEKGEGISDDIPVMGRNYAVSMANKNELFTAARRS